MPIEYYIDIIRFVDIALILLIIMLFAKNWKRDQNVKIAIFYLISIICYLMVSWDVIFQTTFYYIIIIGTFSVPIFFWYFSKSIFDDNFKIDRIYITYLLLNIIVYYGLYYYTFIMGGKNFNFWYTPIVKSGSQTISFGFIVLGIIEAYRGRHLDLLESRIRFRKAFILVTGFLII